MVIIEKNTLEELIENFVKIGGRINPYYVSNPKRSPALVFYKKWYRGKNIREAIKRALSE